MTTEAQYDADYWSLLKAFCEISSGHDCVAIIAAHYLIADAINNIDDGERRYAIASHAVKLAEEIRQDQLDRRASHLTKR
jgi:hypothetical protein